MKRSRQEVIKFWQQHVEAVKSFPGSIQEYCETYEIQASSFYNWRKRLSCSGDSNEAKFLPVLVSETGRQDKSSERPLPNAEWVAEVMLRLIRGLA